MKKILTILVAFVFLFGLITQDSFAMKKMKCMGCGGSYKYKGVEGKFYKQVKHIWYDRQELGLTDAQIKKIKELKKSVMKELIKRDAEIKTVKVEIKTLMWEKPFDLDQVNKLVAEKYDLKKAKTQYIMKSINKLHGILTEEQIDMLD